MSKFERRLAQHALENDCDGVVCGHVHTPQMAEHEGIIYCNTGDWVEHCSALVEYEDGALELLELPFDPPKEGEEWSLRTRSESLRSNVRSTRNNNEVDDNLFGDEYNKSGELNSDETILSDELSWATT